jgi:hypothetical protein
MSKFRVLCYFNKCRVASAVAPNAQGTKVTKYTDMLIFRNLRGYVKKHLVLSINSEPFERGCKLGARSAPQKNAPQQQLSHSTRFPLGSGCCWRQFALDALWSGAAHGLLGCVLACLSSGDCGGHQGGSAVMQQGTFHVPVNSAQMTLIPHYGRISPLKPHAALSNRPFYGLGGKLAFVVKSQFLSLYTLVNTTPKIPGNQITS